MKNRLAGAATLVLLVAATISCNKESGPVRDAVSNKDCQLNRSTQHFLIA